MPQAPRTRYTRRRSARLLWTLKTVTAAYEALLLREHQSAPSESELLEEAKRVIAQAEC